MVQCAEDPRLFLPGTESENCLKLAMHSSRVWYGGGGSHENIKVRNLNFLKCRKTIHGPFKNVYLFEYN